MKKPLIHVSDHALIRYLERVEGYDLDALRARIAGVVATGVDLGASGVRVDGHIYKIVGRTVVTIAPACEPKLTTGGACGPHGTRDEPDV